MTGASPINNPDERRVFLARELGPPRLFLPPLPERSILTALNGDR
jgi:hypothetical protein